VREQTKTKMAPRVEGARVAVAQRDAVAAELGAAAA